MCGFDTTKFGAELNPNYDKLENYCLEDSSHIIRIMQINEESRIFISSYCPCSIIQRCCILILHSQVPGIIKQNTRKACSYWQ